MNLQNAAERLTQDLASLCFQPPVAYVYNPLEYARASYRRYVGRYGRSPREVALVGMNPGPWGMAQTGVPFGEVAAVRHWLEIEAPIGRPHREHPKRPVHGLQCPRSEVSGRRLWGWARERFGTPQRFFERFLVLNYCPLLFLEESGRNLTPDKLPPAPRRRLLEACDRHLVEAIEFLQPRFVIGIGKFAESRVRAVTEGMNASVTVGSILHPSPASPAANRDWAGQAEAALRALGVRLPGD